jgi:hypothetical protein
MIHTHTHTHTVYVYLWWLCWVCVLHMCVVAGLNECVVAELSVCVCLCLCLSMCMCLCGGWIEGVCVWWLDWVCVCVCVVAGLSVCVYVFLSLSLSVCVYVCGWWLVWICVCDSWVECVCVCVCVCVCACMYGGWVGCVCMLWLVCECVHGWVLAYTLLCVWVGASCLSSYLKVRGQLEGVGALLVPRARGLRVERRFSRLPASIALFTVTLWLWKHQSAKCGSHCKGDGKQYASVPSMPLSVTEWGTMGLSCPLTVIHEYGALPLLSVCSSQSPPVSSFLGDSTQCCGSAPSPSITEWCRCIFFQNLVW